MNNNQNPNNKPSNRKTTSQNQSANNRGGGMPNRPPQYQNRGYNAPRQTYPPVKHKSRQATYRAAGLVVLTVIILVMLLISVIIFVARCANGKITEPGNIDSDSVSDSTPNSSTPPSTDNAVTSPTVTTPPEPVTSAIDELYDYKMMTEEDMHKGYLILVNYQNAYSFNTDFKIQPFYGNTNKKYRLRDSLVSLDSYAMDWCNQMMAAFEASTGRHDILVNSSYRTLEEQEEIYSSRANAYGEEYAKAYVAVPGYSEHHTGLAVDFTVYTDKGESKTFDEMTDYPEWLNANAHKYGFIQRYPSDKTDITKIAYENWHYRYIGKPHAYYMQQNNLCLEEYIELLRDKYKFGGDNLTIIDDEGVSWEVYFVSLNGESTQVPVPKDHEYTVSGNNVDGFIVTVKK
ncbi:MAG: hypothetical protein HFE63_08900 [Clostridiales bacterium]|nr:hypothetical protein [Clostridiales bacterium]